mgnify:CR=1 FL=1
MNEQPSQQPSQPVAGRSVAQRGPGLLERIGGREAIERIVTAFYALVEADPELRPLFPEDLAEGREKQAMFPRIWVRPAVDSPCS